MRFIVRLLRPWLGQLTPTENGWRRYTLQRLGAARGG
jgi:hypothetical protein